VKPAFLVLVSIAASSALGGEPPSGWKTVIRGDAESVWDACSDDGQFYASRLIGIYRTLGSQHDGDRQLEVAQLLAQVPDDPRDALRHYLASPDPYDRVFAIQVIIHLGDRRFIPDLEKLTKDTASTKEWDTLPYDSVGSGARLAIDHLRRGTNLVPTDAPLPKWLEAARKMNSP
jgi:hypothetical protein